MLLSVSQDSKGKKENEKKNIKSKERKEGKSVCLKHSLCREWGFCSTFKRVMISMPSSSQYFVGHIYWIATQQWIQYIYYMHSIIVHGLSSIHLCDFVFLCVSVYYAVVTSKHRLNMSCYIIYFSSWRFFFCKWPKTHKKLHSLRHMFAYVYQMVMGPKHIQLLDKAPNEKKKQKIEL